MAASPRYRTILLNTIKIQSIQYNLHDFPHCRRARPRTRLATPSSGTRRAAATRAATPASDMASPANQVRNKIISFFHVVSYLIENKKQGILKWSMFASSVIFAGMRNQRAPLPMQEDVLPTEVATEVAKNEKVTRLIRELEELL